jgi:F0F1-type ATP synthase epsilon subunit
MANLWVQFQQLLRSDPIQVGTVISLNGDGTSTVQLIGGGLLRVQGQGVAVDAKAFIQSGKIQGEAPDLPAYDIEV